MPLMPTTGPASSSGLTVAPLPRCRMPRRVTVRRPPGSYAALVEAAGGRVVVVARAA